MKYLGKKSLSSLVYKILQVFWYLGIAACIFLPFIVADILFFGPVNDSAATGIDMIRYHIFHGLQGEEDWQSIRNTPVAVRIFIMVYGAAFMGLLLSIVNKGREIFINFQDNIVFHEKNVLLISKISKLLIVFSILSVNFSTLLVSIILLILNDIFKNGTALQQEHDLTV